MTTLLPQGIGLESDDTKKVQTKTQSKTPVKSKTGTGKPGASKSTGKLHQVKQVQGKRYKENRNRKSGYR